MIKIQNLNIAPDVIRDYDYVDLKNIENKYTITKRINFSFIRYLFLIFK